MNGYDKVIVVDDGDRHAEGSLTAELAGLGVSSITTSVEAADDVLELIPSPSAILLQMPVRDGTASYRSFLDLADRLRVRKAGIPVILIEAPSRAGGGYGAALRSRLGVSALHEPEL